MPLLHASRPGRQVLPSSSPSSPQSPLEEKKYLWILRSSWSRASGLESSCTRTLAQASSMRSMALSGRNRCVGGEGGAPSALSAAWDRAARLRRPCPLRGRPRAFGLVRCVGLGRAPSALSAAWGRAPSTFSVEWGRAACLRPCPTLHGGRRSKSGWAAVLQSLNATQPCFIQKLEAVIGLCSCVARKLFRVDAARAPG